MAQSISFQSGSKFIGSPIIVEIQGDEVSDIAVFHRVKLTIDGSMAISGHANPLTRKKMELSSPVLNGGKVLIDISSSLRAIASSYVHEIVSVGEEVSYPYITYRLSACDDYMIEGVMYENRGQITLEGSWSALMGSMTDYERALSSQGSIVGFTRKPAIGEIVSSSEYLVYPVATGPIYLTSEISNGPTVNTISLQDKAGIISCGNRTVYVDTNAQNRVFFLFVNGCGVVESASAEMLETWNDEGSTELNLVSTELNFVPKFSYSPNKSKRMAILRCSTGYVSMEWAKWWMHEFLSGDNFRRSGHNQCWVRYNGMWIPCVAFADDESERYNKTKGDLVSINFKVKLSWNGL